METGDMDAFRPSKKPMMSCGILDLTDEVDAWREDCRSELVCASLRRFGDDFCRTGFWGRGKRRKFESMAEVG